MLRVTNLKQGARPMPTVDFLTTLFCQVDDAMREGPKPPQARLYPSEMVTLGPLFALKGVGNRAFYRWLARDYRALFPQVPDRTRLFRLFQTPREWTDRFLARPSRLGIADTFGVELLHPRREGRRPQQLGHKGLSNRRWVIGAKVGFGLNPLGLFVAWACTWARTPDKDFRHLVARLADPMVVLTDPAFHGRPGAPANMKVCPRGTWNTRMLVETVLSRLTRVCPLKRRAHRQADCFRAHLAFMVAAFNLLVQWQGLRPDADGFVRLSIAEFSL